MPKTLLGKAFCALAFIFLFGGITMVISGSVCIGNESLCTISKGASIAVLVVGFVPIILSVVGFVILTIANMASVAYQVSS